MKKRNRKHCVELAKKIALDRDGRRCRRCGRTKESGWQIHGSHILGEGAHPRMSYDPRNIKALCAKCHMWWHSSPTESGHWFRTKYPEWWDEIMGDCLKREKALEKPDYTEVYLDLKNRSERKFKAIKAICES